jgi:hypothetical protein
MANRASVTLSSVGNSAAVNLDWRSGARVNFSITGSSSGSFAVTPQVSLDDLQLVASPSWLNQSSAPLTSNTSVWQLSGPFAALRMSSTALSSAALTLSVLQDHGF